MVTTSMPGAYHLLQMRLVQTDITVNLVTSDCYIFFSKLVHHIYKHQAPIGSKKKKKTVPIQVSTGPEGSRTLRFPDFVTTAQDGGKVVSLTHRPPLPTSKYSWYSFMLEAESIGRILCQ